MGVDWSEGRWVQKWVCLLLIFHWALFESAEEICCFFFGGFNKRQQIVVSWQPLWLQNLKPKLVGDVEVIALPH